MALSLNLRGYFIGLICYLLCRFYFIRLNPFLKVHGVMLVINKLVWMFRLLWVLVWRLSVVFILY